MAEAATGNDLNSSMPLVDDDGSVLDARPRISGSDVVTMERGLGNGELTEPRINADGRE
jgi:hypothetical protein